MKLVVDTYSILGQFLHLNDEEFGEDIVFEGKKFHIPDIDTCKERALQSFQKTIDQFNIKTTDIIMVRDPEGTGAARKRIFPDYKGGRQKRPPQYYAVFNELVEWACEMVMKAGGITATPRVTPAVECDDLINELCKRLPKTVIWSTDRDLLACPATHHYIGGELDPIKFPVPREFIHLYRCIVTGDPSDNIPGCKGFGPKAWDELLELVGPGGLKELEQMIIEGRLHELVEDVPHMKKLQLLIDKADDIYISYKLMSFMHVPAHKIKWEARVTDCTKTLVTIDNYYAVLEEVKSSLKDASHAVIDFETSTCEESRAWVAGTKGSDGKGGVGVDVMASEIAGMGLKVGDKSWYFSVDHAQTRNITKHELEAVIELLKDRRVYAANSTGFENVILYNHFGYFLEGMIDTQLLASYVNENDYLNLKHLSKRDLGYNQTSYEQVMNGRQEMRELTGEEVVSYGIDDVITTDSLQNLHQTILMYEGSLDVFYEVEQHSAFWTSLAFCHGVAFDQAVHARLTKENDENIERTERELEELLIKVGFGDSSYKPLPQAMIKSVISQLYKVVTGREFKSAARSVKGCIPDIDDPRVLEAVQSGLDAMTALHKEHWRPTAALNTGSPKQLSTLLYDLLEAPVRVRNHATEKMREKGRYDGNPATSEDAIENALAFGDVKGDGAECLRKILQLKGYNTRKSLFLDKYTSLVHWKTGRIHCNMRQCGTNTRRFSHSAPNLAQLPKSKGREVRDMITVSDGWEILDNDFSSQELKIQAEDSQCAAFISCYIGENKKDVHSMTGLYVATLQGEKVSSYEEFISLRETTMKPFRSWGKTTNFETSYGMMEDGLAISLRVDAGTARTFIEAKDKAFPGLNPHIEKYKRLCRKRGYSLTFMGARRHLSKSYAMAKTDGQRGKVDRLSWSFRCQGTGAEQTKIAMGRIWRSGVFKNGDCFPMLQVHDELGHQYRADKREEYVPIIHACVVDNYADMGITADSESKIGTHFGSLKEWEK